MLIYLVLLVLSRVQAPSPRYGRGSVIPPRPPSHYCFLTIPQLLNSRLPSSIILPVFVIRQCLA